MALLARHGCCPKVAALSSKVSLSAPDSLPASCRPAAAEPRATQRVAAAATPSPNLKDPKTQSEEAAGHSPAPLGASQSQLSPTTGAASPPGSLKLACPICQRPLRDPGASSFHLGVASRRRFHCGQCRRGFDSGEGFVDCVISSGAREYQEPNLGWAGSSAFQNPLVSFLYERGWRQNFQNLGFPGADEEWAMARHALRGAEGGAVMDVSCGSGLFTRRMAASGLYSLVVGLDFSAAMLRQSREFIQETVPALPLDRIALVRADVVRLPLESGSVAGVHAGAALHCWPSPHLAVAEISRVLRPGGAFAATTFLSPSLPLADALVKPLRKAVASNMRAVKAWEPEELEELCALCGLEKYESDRRGRFIFISARKAIQD